MSVPISLQHDAFLPRPMACSSAQHLSIMKCDGSYSSLTIFAAKSLSFRSCSGVRPSTGAFSNQSSLGDYYSVVSQPWLRYAPCVMAMARSLSFTFVAARNFSRVSA